MTVLDMCYGIRVANILANLVTILLEENDRSFAMNEVKH